MTREEIFSELNLSEDYVIHACYETEKIIFVSVMKKNAVSQIPGQNKVISYAKWKQHENKNWFHPDFYTDMEVFEAIHEAENISELLNRKDTLLSKSDKKDDGYDFDAFKRELANAIGFNCDNFKEICYVTDEHRQNYIYLTVDNESKWELQWNTIAYQETYQLHLLRNHFAIDAVVGTLHKGKDYFKKIACLCLSKNAIVIDVKEIPFDRAWKILIDGDIDPDW